MHAVLDGPSSAAFLRVANLLHPPWSLLRPRLMSGWLVGRRRAPHAGVPAVGDQAPETAARRT